MYWFISLFCMQDPNSQPSTRPPCLYPCPASTLTCTRYSFTPKLSCTSQSSFYCPLHLHCSHYCNTAARLMRNIRPPPDPPCVCHIPYNIGSGNIVTKSALTFTPPSLPYADGLNTKGTRAHTHRELIREWLWEPKGSSFEYN